jgi:Zn-dependent protease with chaperone function
MHLLMILDAVLFAFLLRLIPVPIPNNFNQRWSHNLLLFILPPLFLLMTALAILFMGFHGEMLGLNIIYLGNFLAIIFLIYTIINTVRLIFQSRNTRKKLNNYSEQIILGRKAKILNIDFPYCAQIGVLKPELVISEGLLKILDNEHLEAVLLHEKAHNYYQDSLCFFCLNWLKDLSFWLPKTELLWQDLLLLREIRADQKAATEINPLIIAESLLTVAKNSVSIPFNFATSFSIPTPVNRLNMRIDALFVENFADTNNNCYYWICLLIIFLPWVTILLHN